MLARACSEYCPGVMFLDENWPDAFGRVMFGPMPGTFAVPARSDGTNATFTFGGRVPSGLVTTPSRLAVVRSWSWKSTPLRSSPGPSGTVAAEEIVVVPG